MCFQCKVIKIFQTIIFYFGWLKCQYFNPDYRREYERKVDTSIQYIYFNGR